jgi:hypothetical protein
MAQDGAKGPARAEILAGALQSPAEGFLGEGTVGFAEGLDVEPLVGRQGNPTAQASGEGVEDLGQSEARVGLGQVSAAVNVEDAL